MSVTVTGLYIADCPGWQAALDRVAKEREDQIAKLVQSAGSQILNTIQYSDKKHCFLRVQEIRRNDRDTNTDVANEVITRLLIENPTDYKMEIVQENTGYTNSRVTADGGPGEEFYVERYHQSLKITWE